MSAHLRRYLKRVLVAFTLVTPLIIVVTYQLAPGRTDRDASDVGVRIAAATAENRDATIRTRLATLIESDRERRQPEPEDAIELAESGPVRLVAWYRAAGSEHGVSPYLLEALHQVESSAAPDGCWLNAERSGAVGPFQFKRATFEIYGLDGNDDGIVDICAFSDSLVSAAHYLRAIGADEEIDSPGTRQAFDRYGTDTERVITLARHYRSQEGAVTVTNAVVR